MDPLIAISLCFWSYKETHSQFRIKWPRRPSLLAHASVAGLYQASEPLGLSHILHPAAPQLSGDPGRCR